MIALKINSSSLSGHENPYSKDLDLVPGATSALLTDHLVSFLCRVSNGETALLCTIFTDLLMYRAIRAQASSQARGNGISFRMMNLHCYTAGNNESSPFRLSCPMGAFSTPLPGIIHLIAPKFRKEICSGEQMLTVSFKSVPPGML